ncbi:MAG: YwiC-like family protein [Bacteroidota bacterium]
MKFPRLPLTREHGSWAVLAVPLAVGTASSVQVRWEHAALAIAAMAAFLSHVPIRVILEHVAGRRRDDALLRGARWWAPILVGVALALTSVLVLRGATFLLSCVLIGGATLAVRSTLQRSGKRSSLGDLFAVAGLSLGAPAAFALGSRGMKDSAFILWVEMFLFFGCTVVYVHMKIRAAAQKLHAFSVRDRIQFGWVTLAYHVAVMAIVAVVVSAQRTPVLALAAYLPMSIHAVVGTIRLTGAVQFKRLGFMLLAHSAAFGALLVWAWKGAV